jgi:hypothetical protein
MTSQPPAAAIATLAISILGLGCNIVFNTYVSEALPPELRQFMRIFGGSCFVAGMALLAFIFLRRLWVMLKAGKRVALGVALLAGTAITAAVIGAMVLRFETREPSTPFQLTSLLTISPAQPGNDRPVHASFAVKNTSDRAWQSVGLAVAVHYSEGGTTINFPHSQTVSFSPGQVQIFEDVKAFGAPGSYFVWPRVKVGGGGWSDLGAPVRMTVVEVPGQLKIIGPVTISPDSPADSQIVTMTFAIQNVSAQEMQFHLTGAVHPPNDSEGEHPDDFTVPPVPVILPPGAIYRYRASQSFATGKYEIWPGVEIDGAWIDDLAPHRMLTVDGAG